MNKFRLVSFSYGDFIVLAVLLPTVLTSVIRFEEKIEKSSSQQHSLILKERSFISSSRWKRSAPPFGGDDDGRGGYRGGGSAPPPPNSNNNDRQEVQERLAHTRRTHENFQRAKVSGRSVPKKKLTRADFTQHEPVTPKSEIKSKAKYSNSPSTSSNTKEKVGAQNNTAKPASRQPKEQPKQQEQKQQPEEKSKEEPKQEEEKTNMFLGGKTVTKKSETKKEEQKNETQPKSKNTKPKDNKQPQDGRGLEETETDYKNDPHPDYPVEENGFHTYSDPDAAPDNSQEQEEGNEEEEESEGEHQTENDDDSLLAASAEKETTRMGDISEAETTIEAEQAISDEEEIETTTESDIEIVPYCTLFKGLSNSEATSGRSFTPNLWSKLNIFMPLSYSREDEDLMLRAIQDLKEIVPCLHIQLLRESLDEVPPKDQHLKMNRSGNDCVSIVGRSDLLEQPLDLPSNCMQKGIIQHEIMHALGFQHEKSGPLNELAGPEDRWELCKMYCSGKKNNPCNHMNRFTNKDDEWDKHEDLSYL